jgi:hypothetical protein
MGSVFDARRASPRSTNVDPYRGNKQWALAVSSKHVDGNPGGGKLPAVELSRNVGSGKRALDDQDGVRLRFREVAK